MINLNSTILYVKDQSAAIEFYKSELEITPTLDVPGMTEFNLGPHSRLGLMPLAGAKRLLGAERFPFNQSDYPKAEIYLVLDNAEGYLNRAVSSGATKIHEVDSRDWGYRAGYCMDPHSHVLAFAEIM